MTEENRKKLREYLDDIFMDDTLRIVTMRPAIDVTKPGDDWKTWAPGATAFVLLAIGPVDPVEHRIVRMITATSGI